jgi:hypothetical protein
VNQFGLVGIPFQAMLAGTSESALEVQALITKL